MSAASMIYIVGLSIASMAFIFVFFLLKPSKVTKEKLEKILGDETVERIKAAKNDDEIKEIIRSLSKIKRAKLKTLMESQDIRDLLKAIHEHIIEGNK